MANIVLKTTADDTVISKHDAANDAASGLYINDIKVVGPQGATIADIANDANGTAIATAVNAIIARLEAHGLIASS